MSATTEQALESALDCLAERVAELVVERLAERQPSVSEAWVGPERVAAHLGCKAKRVYEQKERLPHVKDGGRLLFRLSEVDTALRRNGSPSS